MSAQCMLISCTLFSLIPETMERTMISFWLTTKWRGCRVLVVSYCPYAYEETFIRFTYSIGDNTSKLLASTAWYGTFFKGATLWYVLPNSLKRCTLMQKLLEKYMGSEPLTKDIDFSQTENRIEYFELFRNPISVRQRESEKVWSQFGFERYLS